MVQNKTENIVGFGIICYFILFLLYFFSFVFYLNDESYTCFFDMSYYLIFTGIEVFGSFMSFSNSSIPYNVLHVYMYMFTYIILYRD